MTYILSFSDFLGGVKDIKRACADCTSPAGNCLGWDRRCEITRGILSSNSDSCYCSRNKCNGDIKSNTITPTTTKTTPENNSSIQMQYFWPNLMLSFVIYILS